jgi:hypothetical protein
MNDQAIRFVFVIGLILLIAALITLQTLISTQEDTRKLDQSIRLWFGNLGIIFILFMFVLLMLIVFFLPRVIPEIRILKQDLKEMIKDIRRVSAAVEGLTADVKQSTKISELLQSAAHLAGAASKALVQPK